MNALKNTAVSILFLVFVCAGAVVMLGLAVGLKIAELGFRAVGRPLPRTR